MKPNPRVKIIEENGVSDFDGETEKISGPVVYWMNREIRTDDNWSLYFAQDLAKESDVPLVVVYNLVPGFLSGQNRHLTFKVDGLKEVEKKLHDKNIPFNLIIDEKDNSAKQIVNFCKKMKAGALVTDFYPLNLPKKWNQEIWKDLEIPFYEVDSHNIVPARDSVFKKPEYAARTIRPKIYKRISEFLVNFPYLTKQEKTPKELKSEKIDWNKILPKENREDFDWITPGEEAAKKALKKFIKDTLPNYAFDRNDPNKKGQSDLSPYLHYGMLSAHTIALAVVEWVGRPIVEILSDSINRAKNDLPAEQMTKLDHAGAFLEELIIRKELSDNFCLYQKNYDNPACFEPWAAESLHRHLNDEREYVYSLEEFEKAQTHDDLWNAAQMEMVNRGKMHGYMRMYWAKKILEWTENPADAMKIAIELNDKYELDGRDPNGYAGIAWSIGGTHDRPWFERKIFGQIRYMNRNGCEKKFNVDEYIKNNLNSKLL
jgi:deoxyribodipyrimidine photo-lyase